MPKKMKRTVRTVIQAALGVAVGLPLLFKEFHFPGEQWAGFGVILAVAGGFAHFMNSDVGQALMAYFGLDAPEGEGR